MRENRVFQCKARVRSITSTCSHLSYSSSKYKYVCEYIEALCIQCISYITIYEVLHRRLQVFFFSHSEILCEVYMANPDHNNTYTLGSTTHIPHCAHPFPSKKKNERRQINCFKLMQAYRIPTAI